jgi:glycosyltransferase involved in cell wall biosynthesis
MTESPRKKVLILTYYWPPSGGSGVQRWLKFAKYMREFGYEPMIYTADEAEYPSIDESLYGDIPPNLTVLRKKVWEPYKLYKWFTFQKTGHRINAGFLNRDKKGGLAEKISVWIRGNLFIPDARKFWIKPSVRFLIRYLKDHTVHLLVSTGPPHSVHLIACEVSERMDLPWVADFRDPWTRIDYYQDLMLGARANRKHHRLERKVLNTASAVTVISQEMKRQFKEMGCRNIRVITNGFDPEDFDNTGSGPAAETPPLAGEGDQGFSFIHIGSIVPSRNPVVFWNALSELVSENRDLAGELHIKLAGAIDYSVYSSLEEANLVNRTEIIDYLPHKEAVKVLKNARVLLLLINDTPNARGILTGKLFEYMSSGRPILAIGPTNGEVAKVLRETGTGQIVDFHDKDRLKNMILELYGQHREGILKVTAKNLDRYSRRSLAGKMTELFSDLLDNT